MGDVTICGYSLFAQNNYPPLGQLYLVSVLRKAGYNVDFKDLHFLDDSDKGGVLSVLENSSDIIGIGCIPPYIPSLLLIIRELKKKSRLSS